MEIRHFFFSRITAAVLSLIVIFFLGVFGWVEGERGRKLEEEEEGGRMEGVGVKL